MTGTGVGAAARGTGGGPPYAWDMERGEPSGGRTLVLILLAMLAIIGVLVALSVWGSR